MSLRNLKSHVQLEASNRLYTPECPALLEKTTMGHGLESYETIVADPAEITRGYPNDETDLDPLSEGTGPVVVLARYTVVCAALIQPTAIPKTSLS